MRLTLVARNYFKKYINRNIAEATGVTLNKPFQAPKEIRKKNWVYNEHRPWTEAAKEFNNRHMRHKKIFIEPISEEEWKIFKGDRVEVLVGPDKGKQGLVNGFVKERNWCFVEGLNCKYKWVNRSSTNHGIMIKEEKPLLVTTEVSLVDPSDSKKTEVEWRYTEEGERLRVSVRTGRAVPISKIIEDECYDMIKKSTYVEKAKDTKAGELKKVTFVPKLTTFEDDIMQQMGITEERKRAKTFLY